MPRKLKIPELSTDATINLALDTINHKKQALVFVNTKRSAEKTAEEISRKIKVEDKNLNELSEKVLKALSRPTRQCERLALCIKKGIAFHHAGLHAKQKELVENAFRNGVIKIIACTPTLAAGLELPAFRTILKDLKRYGHFGLQYIPVLEYHQMAGRAGRPTYDKYGEAIALASTKAEKDKIYEKYVLGEPEDIYSKLAVEPVLRTYLLSLIAANFVNSYQQILDFFEQTFWAFQFRDMDKLSFIIEKMLSLLEEWEFIKSSSTDDFQSADALNNNTYKATLLGKRVAELYIDPLTAHQLINAIRRAASSTIIPLSLLQMVSHTIEMRPLLKTRTKEWDNMQDTLIKYGNYLLEVEPSMYEPEYEDFIDSVKTALFMQDWIEEKDEEDLLETYNIRPGEIRVKLDLADWLLYACEELTRILHFQPIIKEIKKLRLRMKHGAKEELLPLLRLKDIGRVRARKLFNSKIKDIADIKKSNITTLIQILGRNVALSIKEQVGQDYSKLKVPEKKRKGQVSLHKYQPTSTIR